MAFDLSESLARRGEVRVSPVSAARPLRRRGQPQPARAESDVLSREERLYLKAMRMRKPAFLNVVMPSEMREVYEAALPRLHTSAERRLLQKAGMWNPRRDVLYSDATWTEEDWAEEDSVSRALRAAGWRLAKGEAAQRAFYEGVDAGTKAFALGTVAVLGGGQAAHMFGERHARNMLTDAVVADVNTALGLTDDAPPVVARTLSAEDAATIDAAERGLTVINSFRYSAATPRGDRHPDGNDTTNNRADAVSSILAGTNILFNLGLFREGSDLAGLGRDELAGELAGKAQLESGLAPTVEAVNAHTEDRARGLFQLKPETTFSLLGLHGHDLAEVDGLLAPEVAEVLEAGMHRLGARIASGRVSQIRPQDRRLMASLATNYDFQNPGAVSRHSNLFHLAYDMLTEAEKEIIRGAVVDTTEVAYGPVTGTRGAVLSTALAGLLADELDVPDDLAERYGLRVFDYISHQAGEGNANQIIEALVSRDQHQQGSAEWQRADVRLRRTIFHEVHIGSNMSVYADTERLEADRAARARENAARVGRRQRALPEVRMSERYVRDWDNLVEHIDAMHGGDGANSLSAAVAAVSRAVREGHVVLSSGSHNALAFDVAHGPTRAADMGPEQPERANRRVPAG